VLDYHLHLWSHRDADVSLRLEQIAEYCDVATRAGVVEIALTEHLFRFVQSESIVAGLFDDEASALRASMREYWDHHARNDLDAYVETALAAKAAGLPVVVGLEVDHYRGRMDRVAALLEGYPFDVLLGSVHWIGAWRFDDLDDVVHMAEWPARRVDACWDAYADAIAELAASGACDVLAHPDLIKVAGYVPEHPEEWWDRLAELAASSVMAAEVSSAGWKKTCNEQYPARGLLARFAQRGVGLTTASDAHGVERVADRADDLREVLAAAGIDELVAYRGRTAHKIPVGPARPAVRAPVEER
jgi:histidinol-phosphatase (PHP family)